jgi:hypothetical protein
LPEAAEAHHESRTEDAMPTPLTVIAEIAEAERLLREAREEAELAEALEFLRDEIMADAEDEKALAAAWRWWLEEAPCSDSVN